MLTRRGTRWRVAELGEPNLRVASLIERIGGIEDDEAVGSEGLSKLEVAVLSQTGMQQETGDGQLALVQGPPGWAERSEGRLRWTDSTVDDSSTSTDALIIAAAVGGLLDDGRDRVCGATERRRDEGGDGLELAFRLVRLEPGHLREALTSISIVRDDRRRRDGRERKEEESVDEHGLGRWVLVEEQEVVVMRLEAGEVGTAEPDNVDKLKPELPERRVALAAAEHAANELLPAERKMPNTAVTFVQTCRAIQAKTERTFRYDRIPPPWDVHPRCLPPRELPPRLP